MLSTLLIVEDERSIADTLVFALEREGFAIEWLELGRQAVERVGRGGLALVILDVGLPDMSGFEACKEIRRFSEVPILFLTARAEEIDRVVGLEIGADDYVVKPFSPREVAARVRAILKRTGTTRSVAETAGVAETAETAGVAEVVGQATHADFRVDAKRLEISQGGRALELTAQEYRLFAHLIGQPERVFSRQQLLDAIGAGSDASYERNIDGHIRSLRAKIRELAPGRDPIQTHRGFGYSYQPGRAASRA